MYPWAVDGPYKRYTQLLASTSTISCRFLSTLHDIGSHLRLKVIDEADRLLAQSFQDWLSQVLAATRPPQRNPSVVTSLSSPTPQSTVSFCPHPDALAPAFFHLLDGSLSTRTDIDENKEASCQKLLFSATLTRDPAKIAALQLRDPKYVVVQSPGKEGGVLDVVMEKFTMPATLTVSQFPAILGLDESMH